MHSPLCEPPRGGRGSGCRPGSLWDLPPTPCPHGPASAGQWTLGAPDTSPPLHPPGAASSRAGAPSRGVTAWGSQLLGFLLIFTWGPGIAESEVGAAQCCLLVAAGLRGEGGVGGPVAVSCYRTHAAPGGPCCVLGCEPRVALGAPLHVSREACASVFTKDACLWFPLCPPCWVPGPACLGRFLSGSVSLLHAV